MTRKWTGTEFEIGQVIEYKSNTGKWLKATVKGFRLQHEGKPWETTDYIIEPHDHMGTEIASAWRELRTVKTANDFSHLDDLLLADNTYDLDLYAAQTGMDQMGGMWTPAYERKIRAEVAHMDAHNAALSRHDGTQRVTVLARFAGMIVALVAGLLAR